MTTPSEATTATAAQMPKHKVPSRAPAIGDIVSIQVTKLLPFGILGILPDGSRGVVREREIGWSTEERQHWQERYLPNSTHKVRIIDTNPDNWELSLRMVRYDPWAQVVADAVGQLVKGVVTGFGAACAYIELENGIRALLDETELPAWVDEPLHDALWVGDQIYAQTKQIDLPQRLLHLTLKDLQRQRWGVIDKAMTNAAVTDKVETQQAANAPAPPASVSFPVSARSYTVLVVEDDPIQNKAIVQGLCHAGHTADAALDGDAVLCILADTPYDVVICDVNLGTHDGIDLVAQIRKAYPAMQCIVMTDWMTADHREPELRQLNQRGAPLLIKPVLPEEFLLALAEPERYLLRWPGSDDQARGQLFAMRSKLAQHQSTKREIFNALRQLRGQSRADKIVLFRLDSVQRVITVVAQYGTETLEPTAVHQLLYSPVRDVAEDRRVVVIGEIDQVEAYARYLIPLLPFRSCLGLPVPADVADQYALFLFYGAANAPTKVLRREAQVTARLIGVLLERQRFHEQNAELQRTILMGHLARGLIHETNHQMSPILFALSDLSDQCALMERYLYHNSAQAKAELLDVRNTVQQLTENMRKLVKTSRLFGRIAIQDAEDLLRMEQMVEQSIELVRDAANRAHVRIDLYYPKHPPLITRLKQTQVQQVIINLLLNAIQQIERIRPEGGAAHVAVALAKSSAAIDVIRVTVEDDGPGIHVRQWMQIFDLGMTTRLNTGSGMGLYIAQRLMEDCGGRLYVGESYVHWGTKMVAEFPIYLPLDGG